MSNQLMDMNNPQKVVLIKSLRTKNRFYTLVEESRNIHNADTVEDIPDDLLLGIAYPCLEDGLNDFAVIRTTYDTLDFYAADDPIRQELISIINDSRDNLMRRLTELRDRIAVNKALFLGTDYNEFKSYTLTMVSRGHQRRTLDSMMKLDVFSSVAIAEGFSEPNELPYKYEFCNSTDMNYISELHPREFIVYLFNDVLDSVMNDANYSGKYMFDRNVFQKFIAVMFVNYATTDPMFYGVSRHDYGVSSDKEMDDTPLYIAIRRELSEAEFLFSSGDNQHIQTNKTVTDSNQLEHTEESTSRPEGIIFPEEESPSQHHVHLPEQLVNEDVLLSHITSACSAARYLHNRHDGEVRQMAKAILSESYKLVEELKKLGIISHLANNPAEMD